MIAKSNIILAAGLLGKTFAQGNSSVSTITQDVYQSTTTISADCSVCTTNAVVSAYTVVVSSGVTTTIGSSTAAITAAVADAVAQAASAAADAASSASAIAATATGESAASSAASLASAASVASVAAAAVAATSTGTAGSSATTGNGTCAFQLAVNGTTSLQQISDGQIQAHISILGQISDGQIQSDSGLTSSTFTISNDMVYDQAGRICSISGQSQNQFQCNYVPTTGSTTTAFSVVGSNLAFNDDTQFYACLLGDATDGYNIYQSLNGNQNGCLPITLEAVYSDACSASSSTPAAPAAATTAAATVTPAAVTTPEVTSAVVAPTPETTPAAGASEVTSTATAPSSDATSTTSASTTADALPIVSSMPIASANGAANIAPRSVAGLIVAAAFSYILL